MHPDRPGRIPIYEGIFLVRRKELTLVNMRVTTCTINVGKSLGNRELGMELLSFVDLFFILKAPAKRNDEKEECERAGFELLSFCKGSGVEVLVKTDIVGLVSLVRHNELSTVVRYNNAKGEEKLFGGVYLRPGKKKEEAMEKLDSLNDCDIIVGDLNARHPRWGSGGGQPQELIRIRGQRLRQQPWIPDRRTGYADV